MGRSGLAAAGPPARVIDSLVCRRFGFAPWGRFTADFAKLASAKQHNTQTQGLSGVLDAGQTAQTFWTSTAKT